MGGLRGIKTLGAQGSLGRDFLSKSVLDTPCGRKEAAGKPAA